MYQNVSKKNKKFDNGEGGWDPTNPSFFRIFGINLTWQNRLLVIILMMIVMLILNLNFFYK